MTQPDASPLSASFADYGKHHILSLLPAESRILAVASARIYFAPFNGRGEDWVCTGLQGSLVFGSTAQSDEWSETTLTSQVSNFVQNYWFRLIDGISGKGVVWQYQIPAGFEYRLDKPFFHVFSAMTRMFGFRFDDDGEAARFYRAVVGHFQATEPQSKRKSRPSTPKNRVSPAIISAPAMDSFVHLAHVGFNEDGYLEVPDLLTPRWKETIQGPQAHRRSKNIDDDSGLIDGFWTSVTTIHSQPPTLQAAPPPHGAAFLRRVRMRSGVAKVNSMSFVDGFWKGPKAARRAPA